MNQPENLADIVAQYIEEKRAIGFNYSKNEQVLKRVINLADQLGYSGVRLDRELVRVWCTKTSYETESNHQHRISILRGLAEYMSRLGYPAYIYLDKPYKSYGSTYQPHIFTNEELSKLFLASENLINTSPYPFRSRQYVLILKMLYSTGMRSSELMHLKKDDVDLQSGILHIQEAKFNKERFIPLDHEMLQQSRDYDTYIRSFVKWGGSEYFFFNSEGHMLKDIYHPFRKILRMAGISHGGRGSGPRVHDLRHTFAVHCLRNWVRAGKDLTVCLPYLSVYMGHSGIRSSQYYLRLTAELYPDIVKALDNDYGWIIPEVNDYGNL